MQAVEIEANFKSDGGRQWSGVGPQITQIFADKWPQKGAKYAKRSADYADLRRLKDER